jgi:hypothetical protein
MDIGTIIMIAIITAAAAFAVWLAYSNGGR